MASSQGKSWVISVGDQGAAEPSAEGFGERPVKTWLILAQRSRQSGSPASMTSRRRRSRSVKSRNCGAAERRHAELDGQAVGVSFGSQSVRSSIRSS